MIRSFAVAGYGNIQRGSVQVRFGNAFSVVHPLAAPGAVTGKAPLRKAPTGVGSCKPGVWAEATPWKMKATNKASSEDRGRQ